LLFYELTDLQLSDGAEIYGGLAYRYIPGTGYVPLTTTINPGEGVWAYITKACTITYPEE